MKRLLQWLAAFAVILSTNAAINIEVSYALAPNAFGSPNYAAWVGNTTYAVENGLTSYGAPGPGQYNRVTGNLDYNQIVVTGFPSWLGNADPAGTFGPAYAAELGNRLHAPLHIVGTGGTTFSIDKLSFTMTSSDPGNGLGFSFAAGSYSYGSQYYGIQYGLNGVKGGGDDVIITSGPSSVLVNEIIGRGSGNAYAAYSTDPGASNQDKIFNLIANFSDDGPFTVTATYSLEGSSSSAEVLIGTEVPENSTWAAIAFLTLPVGWVVLRRRK